jgi:hypothetical protein
MARNARIAPSLLLEFLPPSHLTTSNLSLPFLLLSDIDGGRGVVDFLERRRGIRQQCGDGRGPPWRRAAAVVVCLAEAPDAV